MSLPRFFCDQTLETGATIDLEPDTAHYIGRVLRLKAGAELWLFNGQGGQFLASLQQNGKALQAQILSYEPIERELPQRITVAQGLASGNKMDWITEKSAEVGVSHLAPIAARHSVLQLTGERLTKRVSHWQRVAQSASEQCGRNRVMGVSTPQSLEAFLHSLPTDPHRRIIFCDPDASNNLDSALADVAHWPEAELVLLIGPEGGWSEIEKAQALKAGAFSMRFGERILRTETAAIALVSACSARLGWL